MLFEELKNKYPNAQLSLYGDCLIIPMSEYTKEKEKQLQAEGHISRITDYQFNEVWAVSLKKTETYKKEPFPEPPKESDKTKNMRLAAQSPDWDPREEQHLLKRWEELGKISNEQKGNQLKSEFPKRSAAALIQKHYKLKAKQEREQAKKDGEKPEAPKETTAATSQDLEYLGKIHEALLKVTEPLNKRISDLETELENLKFENIRQVADDVTGIKQDILHLINNDEELKYLLLNHTHNDKTGDASLPLTRWKK
jgi:hypothetical protein